MLLVRLIVVLVLTVIVVDQSLMNLVTPSRLVLVTPAETLIIVRRAVDNILDVQVLTIHIVGVEEIQIIVQSGMQSQLLATLIVLMGALIHGLELAEQEPVAEQDVINVLLVHLLVLVQET